VIDRIGLSRMWFISASSEVIPAAKRSSSRYFANAGACTIRRTSLTPFSLISASRSSHRKRGSMRGGAKRVRETMTVPGQSRYFDRAPLTSGLPL
jgi:hypothetical protein